LYQAVPLWLKELDRADSINSISHLANCIHHVLHSNEAHVLVDKDLCFKVSISRALYAIKLQIAEFNQPIISIAIGKRILDCINLLSYNIEETGDWEHQDETITVETASVLRELLDWIPGILNSPLPLSESVQTRWLSVLHNGCAVLSFASRNSVVKGEWEKWEKFGFKSCFTLAQELPPAIRRRQWQWEQMIRVLVQGGVKNSTPFLDWLLDRFTKSRHAGLQKFARILTKFYLEEILLFFPLTIPFENACSMKYKAKVRFRLLTILSFGVNQQRLI
jgi:hypothetical protein